MSDRRPTFADVLEAAKEAARLGVRTWAPAKVVKWDADKQRADCQVLIKNVHRDEEDERQVKSWPVVTGVPVEFPGAGGYRITFPISDGNAVIDSSRAAATTGALMFSHVSLDKWLSGTGGEVDPELDHAFAPTDAKFFPGLHPFGAPWDDVPTDHMTIGKDGADDVQIHFHATSGVLGAESQAEWLPMFETFLTDLASAWSTLYTILQAGTVGGPTAQQLQQVAQFPTTNLYTRLAGGGTQYKSTKWKNK